MGWRVQYSIPGRDGMIEREGREKIQRGGRERERVTHHSIIRVYTESSACELDCVSLSLGIFTHIHIRYKIAEITKYLGLLPG